MVQLIYYPSKMYMDCRVLFYISEKVIMEFETFFHISIYQSSLSQVYTCISAKIAEKKVFVYIFKHCLLTIADDTETFFSLPGLLTPSLFL